MKNISLLVVVSVIMLSCKNTSEDKTNTAANDTETESSDSRSLPEGYKLSLAQWSYHKPIHGGKMDPMDFAEYASKLGFEGIEYVDQLFELDSTLPYQDAVMKLALQWKEKNETFGIEPVLIMIDEAGELADPSEAKRKEAIQKHKYWVDAAAAINSSALRVNLFGLTQLEAWHKASVNALKELGAYAASKNVKILAENHAQLSNNAAYVAAVISEVDMPNVGTLPDFDNFCVMREGGSRWGPAPCVEEYDRYKGIAELMPFAGGVSAKSHDFDENGDETTIDYYKMFQIVKDSGFKGYIGVEYENKSLMDPEPGILATKALIIKALSQAK